MAVVSKTSMQRSPKTGRSNILYIVLSFVAGAICMLILTPETVSPSPILSMPSATEAPRSRNSLRSVETPIEVAAVATEEEEEEEPKAKTKGPTIEFPPGTKSITLDIGTNSNPILPLKSAGPCSKVLAFEPIVPETIPKHPQLVVIPAAVSNDNSLSTMNVYNVGGVSSSLGKVNKDAAWNSNENRGEPKVVPVLTMLDVLTAIPQDITIDMIDTDMQGFDFTAISSAMEEIKARGVKYLKTEVYMNNINYGYQGAKNDLCEEWIPMMQSHGYTIAAMISGGFSVKPGYAGYYEALRKCATGDHFSKLEGYALWALDGTPTTDLAPFRYSSVQDEAQGRFTEEEYAACNKQ